MGLLGGAAKANAANLIGCQGGDFADSCSLREMTSGGSIVSQGIVFGDFYAEVYDSQNILVRPFEFGGYADLFFERYVNGARVPIFSVGENTSIQMLVTFTAFVDPDAVLKPFGFLVEGVTVSSGALSPTQSAAIFNQNSPPFPHPLQSSVIFSCEPGATCLRRTDFAGPRAASAISVDTDLIFHVQAGTLDRFAVGFSTIPEPASVGLLLTAIVAVVVTYRRRQFDSA
ncbi:PEP-CTERM sorting domain-containing protein [Elioraea rosea]|uniref:PEP-CTERM sorting domain-containing protein n=1 Tax=Elioraea rosea TaxID=2492390 RepID=UPI001315575E|nr:PEP-CTERM sorting domain-containing protein [Elioraea rosea]